MEGINGYDHEAGRVFYSVSINKIFAIYSNGITISCHSNMGDIWDQKI